MNSGPLKKVIIVGAPAIAGFAIRQLVQKKWKLIFKEDPPTIHPLEEVNWKNFLIWSVVTGTVISSVRLATERYFTRKLKK